MIEIHSKEEIWVPGFASLSEPGWQDKARQVLEQHAYGWNKKMAEPVFIERLNQIETKLKCQIPEGLKTFYQLFGAAEMNEILLQPDEWYELEDSWVSAFEENFAEQDLAVLPDLVVFGDGLGDDNVFCFHKTSHEVYYFDHDGDPYIIRLFTCVDDYLKGLLVKCQQNFITDRDADEWVIEILIDLFGKQVVRKWMY